jgi:hypothetical protein
MEHGYVLILPGKNETLEMKKELRIQCIFIIFFEKNIE